MSATGGRHARPARGVGRDTAACTSGREAASRRDEMYVNCCGMSGTFYAICRHNSRNC